MLPLRSAGLRYGHTCFQRASSFRLVFARCQSTASAAPFLDAQTPTEESAPPIHYIRTLDPAKLTPDDLVDLSGQKLGLFAVPGLRKADGSPHLLAFPYPGPAFPPNTRGFLYLARAQPLAHALCFRLAPDASPPVFKLGTDLRAAGLRWAVPLVYGSLWYPAVAHLVRADALLSEDEVARMWALKRTIRQTLLPARTPLLVARNQPFLLDFARPVNHVMLLARRQSRDVMLKMWIPSPQEGFMWHTADEKAKRKTSVESRSDADVDPGTLQGPRRTFYDGTALVRFEPSPLSRHLKEENRAWVLRVMKVITPIVPRLDMSVSLPAITEGLFLPAIVNDKQVAIWSWPVTNMTGGLLNAMPAPGYNDAEYT